MKTKHETTTCNQCGKQQVRQIEPVPFAVGLWSPEKDGWITARVPNGSSVGGEHVDFCCFVCAAAYCATRGGDDADDK